MYPVYLNNAPGNISGGTNNLKVLTQQYNDGKRSRSTIFAILTGMGYSSESVEFALDNYLDEPVDNMQDQENDIYNKEEEMNYNDECEEENEKSKGGLTINIVVTKLTDLKNKLNNIGMDESNINYSSNSSKSIVENVLSDIRDLNKNFKSLKDGNLSEKEIVITKQQIHPAAFKSNPAYYYANLTINNLNGFSNIVAIKDYINEMTNYLKDNFYTNYVSNLIYEMESRTDKDYYFDAIKDLTALAKENEQYITESMNVILNKHSWIPKVKYILEHNANKTKKLVSNSDVKVELLHSPIQINEDGSYIFVMDNNYYQVNKNETLTKVTEANVLTPLFRQMTSVLNEFNINGNTLKIYKPHSTLEFILEDNTIKINGVSVNKRDVSHMRNAIISSNFYNMNELNKIENILLVLENYGLIKEIDIVTRLKGLNGNTVNIIKINEDRVYINRVHNGTLINELFETTNYKNAQQIVNEYVNFDITNSVYSILDRDSKLRANLNNELVELKDHLNFLTESLTQFKQKTVGLENEAIKEAIEVLETEIRVKEVTIQSTYDQLAKLS